MHPQKIFLHSQIIITQYSHYSPSKNLKTSLYQCTCSVKGYPIAIIFMDCLKYYIIIFGYIWGMSVPKISELRDKFFSNENSSGLWKYSSVVRGHNPMTKMNHVNLYVVMSILFFKICLNYFFNIICTKSWQDLPIPNTLDSNKTVKFL